mgnify:CR=1 FL=1|tara:strand:- start:51 stop:1112 length:1062 start_codon:yes stop_codon:yes gene_type:complete
MKKIVFITACLLFTNFLSFSQKTCIFQSAIIRIDNEQNIPVIHENASAETITLTHNEQFITDIFAKYDIYEFKKAFPNPTSESLKNLYSISFANKDLINELFNEVSNEVFFIDSKFEGTNVDQHIIDIFSQPKSYTLKNFIFTSDAASCSFDCDLNPIPEDLNLSIKIFFNDENSQLVIENNEVTSCGNSFKLQFKNAVDTENELILWEAISENPCFDATSNLCEIERTFFETISSGFSLIKNENSIVLKSPNQVFGENVFSFEEKSLSILNEEFDKFLLNLPNPITNFIDLKTIMQEVTISKVLVFDSLGKNLIETKKNLEIIDTSILTAGIYFLQLETEKGVIIRKKIIKE